MNFGWEGEKEKLKRYMKISAKKKMEWLNQMLEFSRMAYKKKQKIIFQKLRESRGLR